MTSESAREPAPAPPARRPQKPRPSAAWFVAGIVLILVATVLAFALVAWALVAFVDSDATVRADGQPHRVHVSTDGDRMLWLAEDDTTCRVADAATGQEIPLRTVADQVERSDSGVDLDGLYRFSPGSGDLEVTCTAAAGTDPDDDLVVIGSVPALQNLALAVVVAVVLPGVLALAGLVIILWTGILWSLRPARSPGR